MARWAQGRALAIAVSSVRRFDRMTMGDPVGALRVHRVNGIAGTAAVGSSATGGGFGFGGGAAGLVRPLTAILAVGARPFPLNRVASGILKAALSIRVSAHEETEGLDSGGHRMEAAPALVQHGHDLAGGGV